MTTAGPLRAEEWPAPAHTQSSWKQHLFSTELCWAKRRLWKATWMKEVCGALSGWVWDQGASVYMSPPALPQDTSSTAMWWQVQMVGRHRAR